MDKGIEILEIKVKRQRLEGLYVMHEYMLGLFAPADNMEHLLHAHLVQMYWMLEDKLNHKSVKEGKQKLFTIKITAAQAMAFCLFWGNEKFSMSAPGAVDITETIKLIDKVAKQPGGLYGN